MPRQARLDMPGALHHIMVRGINKTEIFKDDEDRCKFLERLGEDILEGKCSIYAWVLMDNHIHILFKSGEKGISTVMRRVLTWYAVYYNHRYRRTGHLFENRYKSILCDEDSYLLELIRYIHLNPIRAGIVKGIKELDKYRWSGHSAISGYIKYKWMDSEYVLSQFGRRKRKAKEAYKRFIIDGLRMGHRPDLTGGGLIRSVGGWSEVVSMMRKNNKTEYDERILGSGDFVSNILKELESKEIRQLKIRKSGEEIKDIIEAECKKEGIAPIELRNGSRRARVSRARMIIAYKSKVDLGLTNAEIARHLGVNTSAISKIIIKLERESVSSK